MRIYQLFEDGAKWTAQSNVYHTGIKIRYILASSIKQAFYFAYNDVWVSVENGQAGIVDDVVNNCELPAKRFDGNRYGSNLFGDKTTFANFDRFVVRAQERMTLA
jgi:hypothetical protein